MGTNDGDRGVILARRRAARAAITPMLYYAGAPDRRFSALTAHVEPGRMREVVATAEAIWARVSGGAPSHVGFVGDAVAKQYDADAQRGQMFAGFAVFAILIACLGLYGLAAFTAQRRTKEIGMRKVLGANVLDIVKLLVWQFSRPVLLANVIAWPAAYLLMRRWLADFRYAIDLTSPVLLAGIFGGAAVLALALALAWLTTAGHAYHVARESEPGAARGVVAGSARGRTISPAARLALAARAPMAIAGASTRAGVLEATNDRCEDPQISQSRCLLDHSRVGALQTLDSRSDTEARDARGEPSAIHAQLCRHMTRRDSSAKGRE